MQQNKILLRLGILFLLTVYVELSANAQKQFVLQSKYLASPDTSWIFLPANQELIGKLPVVIMLHGYGSNYKQWNQIINLQDYSNHYQCIIVCPDGQKDSWYFDSPVEQTSQYEHFFVEDFFPYLKQHYEVDTTAIFITGLSMGGHGALYLFMKHPELFASAGSSSGTLDLTASSQKDFSLSKKLGTYTQNTERFKSYSCLHLLPNIQSSTKPILFDCGNHDHLYQANQAFKTKCDALNVNAFYFSFPGEHNAEYWKESIQWHFEFFSRIYLNNLE
jgi:S-formylglutathione hydrolase FrmB